METQEFLTQEFLLAKGSRMAQFRVYPGSPEFDPFVEVLTTGATPEPDQFEDLGLDATDDVSYCFEEGDVLESARAYWRKLQAIGYRLVSHHPR